MANEITVLIRGALRNPPNSTPALIGPDFNSGSIRFNQTTQASGGGVVIVPTSDTDISALFQGGITDPAWLFLKNLDATNFVDLGPNSGGAMVKLFTLRAGGVAMFELDTTAVLRGQADTASVKLEYALYAR